MKIHATLRTTEYRGDRTADVMIACEVREGETVDELCGRVLKPQIANHGFSDWIELRLVKEAGDAQT